MSESKSTTSGIYAIRCIANGKVYVGSSTAVSSRWNAHRLALGKGRHFNTHLQSAWTKYGADAFVFEVLEHCEADASRLMEREQHHIDRLRASCRDSGFNARRLAWTNLGNTHTLAARAKMSAAKRGRKLSEDVIAKHRGKRASDETRAKMSASRRGKVLTEETRGKISEKAKGRPKSKDHRDKIGTASRGRPVSIETRAKLSSALTGKRRPPEVIAKILATKAKCKRGRSLYHQGTLFD